MACSKSSFARAWCKGESLTFRIVQTRIPYRCAWSGEQGSPCCAAGHGVTHLNHDQHGVYWVVNNSMPNAQAVESNARVVSQGREMQLTRQTLRFAIAKSTSDKTL